jgi:DNA-binding MarR family transcriptional regulator
MRRRPLSAMAASDRSRTGYEQIGTGLYRLQRLLSSRRVSTSLAGAAGAPIGQQAMQVVRALRDGRPRPVAEAARAARMDVGAASRQLRALDEMGLTERSPSPDNASIVLVRLTAEGLAVARRLQEVNNRHLLHALADWTDAEREALGAQLLRLVDDLQRTPYEPDR